MDAKLIQPGMLVKINKPENVSEYPTWVEDVLTGGSMEDYDQVVIRVGKIIHYRGTIIHNNWAFNIKWLTPIKE